MRFRAFSVVVALLLLFVPLSSASIVGQFNSANTVIVLPTTKVVNGTPVHINEDAITGSRLGAFLVLQGVKTFTYRKTVVIPVEYHSVLIPDDNQTYFLTERDMPDLGLNFSTEPVGRSIVLMVNFSRVLYNSTLHAAEFLDRSVEIVFNENTTPLNVTGNYKVFYNTVDGKDVMYLYTYAHSSGNMTSIGGAVSMGGWTIKFLDINLNQSEALISLTYPSGIKKLKTMSKGHYYLMYVDARGNEDFEEYTAYPSARVEELLKNGSREVFVFSPTDFFIGINQAKTVIYEYWFYYKARQYEDGQVYKGQWVWDIDPEKGLYTLYLHVQANSTEFRPVIVGADSNLSMPISSWNLVLQPVFNRTPTGGVIVGVLGYRFVRTEFVRKTVSIKAQKIVATNDVYSFIVNDTSLQFLPSDKNVIIIGGWVSNKAWRLLEEVYGSGEVDKLKTQVLENGYVVAELKNPYNPNFYVVVLAGRTYRQTAEAVKIFMEQIQT